MSIAIVRGCIPVPYRHPVALTTTPVRIDFGRHMHLIPEFAERTNLGTARYLTIQNHDTTNDLRVYFHEGDLTSGHYVTVHNDTATSGYGIWCGPVEGRSIWVRANAATVSAFDMVAFMRRG